MNGTINLLSKTVNNHVLLMNDSRLDTLCLQESYGPESDPRENCMRIRPSRKPGSRFNHQGKKRSGSVPRGKTGSEPHAKIGIWIFLLFVKI